MTWLVERRALLDGYRRAERRALEEVYLHYAPELTGFLTRGFTFSSDGRSFRFAGYHQPFDLDNALQDTFMRAFGESARAGYDGLRPFTNYLYTIARNLVMDEFRRKEVPLTSFVEIDREPEHEPDGTQLPAEQSALHDELRKLYRQFLERLTERDRTFFEMRYDGGGTQVEAGQKVGLSHMQARTLEKKLQEQFLAFMKANGYLEFYRP